MKTRTKNNSQFGVNGEFGKECLLQKGTSKVLQGGSSRISARMIILMAFFLSFCFISCNRTSSDCESDYTQESAYSNDDSYRTCPFCNGSGVCSTCGGTGVIASYPGGVRMEGPCGECYNLPKYCSLCKGEGVIRKK